METNSFWLPLVLYSPKENHSFAGLYLKDNTGSLPIKVLPGSKMLEQAEFAREAINSHVALVATVNRLRVLLARAAPWISKANADGAFANCASPHGAEKLLEEIRTALKEANES